MNSEIWRPLGFDTEDKTTYDALHDGVPPWLEKSLEAWNLEILEGALDGGDGDAGALSRFHKIERELRVSLRLPKSLQVAPLARSVLLHFRIKDKELVLTDFLLSKAEVSELGGIAGIEALVSDSTTELGRLEALLKSSGSMWAVGIRTAGKLGLVQRVPEGVQLSADEAMRSSGHAGRRLAEAWGAAFGIAPDPAKAYALAVKAVEDAALPKVPLKTNDHRTLGSVIRVLNSAKYDAADWTLGFQREDKHYSNGQTLVAMLKTLWSGQTDRHGGDHEVASGTVISQESAEAAVMLAVPLVRWFSSDFIATIGNSTKLAPE